MGSIPKLRCGSILNAGVGGTPHPRPMQFNGSPMLRPCHCLAVWQLLDALRVPSTCSFGAIPWRFNGRSVAAHAQMCYFPLGTRVCCILWYF
eukprot:gene19174-biopygen20510